MRITLLILVINFSLSAQNLKREVSWGFRFTNPSNGKIASAEVNPASPAAKAGLKDSDILLIANGKALSSPADVQHFSRAVKSGDIVNLTIERGSQRLNLSFKPDPKPLERFENTDVSYGEVKTKDGYFVRTITTMPQNRKGKLPGIFFVGWLSCDPIELNFSNMDGWAHLTQDFVTKSGMVFMRTEKPGLGDSQGPDCSQCDLTQDLNAFKAAFRQFKQNPNVDSTKIFVFGGSIGGALAPVLMQDENLKGIIVANTFGRTWFEHFMDFERSRLQLVGGKSFAEVNNDMKLFAEFYTEYLINKKAPAQIIKAKPSLGNLWYDGPESQFGRPSIYHHQVQDLNVPGAWEKIDYPVLVIYGELDWIMTKQEHEYIVNLVNATHQGNGELIVIKGMDHHFSIYGNLKESFEASSINYSKDVFPIIKQWMERKLN